MAYYGIYKITNLVNGKMYIGQHITDDIDDGYMGSGQIIKLAVKKYGRKSFRKEWIMFCEDEDELNYMERVYVDQTWVDRADTYNLCLGGNQARHTFLGRKHSQETINKIRKAAIGRKSSMKGKHHTTETKQKMSASHKGHIVSASQREEHSRRMSGQGNPMFGKHHTKETRQKMQQAKLKKKTEII